MATTVSIDLRQVARGLGVPVRQVQTVVELLDDGNTVPFITRYRKDQTGGLDEEQVRQVQARLTKMRQLAERKQTILRSIESQGKLTEDLAKQIHSASTTKRLEDLYLPYKPKKQTLATLARTRGLEPLACEILAADAACADLDGRSADFVNTDRQVATPAEALLGAGHILAEQFSERADLRGRLREIFHRSGKFVSKRIGGDPEERGKKEPEAKKPNQSSQVSDQAGPPPAETLPADTLPADTLPADTADSPAETDKAAAEAPEASDTSSQPSTESTATPDDHAQPPVEASELPTADVEVKDVVAEQSEPSESPQSVAQAEEQAAIETAQPTESQPTESQPTESQPTESQPTEAQPTEAQPTEPAATLPPDASAAAPDATEKTPTAKGLPKKAKPALTQKEQRKAKREQKKKKAEEKKISAFSDYFDYSEEIKKIPVHRTLAINRGERAKVLRVKIEADSQAMEKAVDELLVPPEHPHAEYLRGCGRDALNRLILPSLEREVRRELTDRAEVHAVKVFAKNLRNLLLQPPVRDRRVLAVDPGFRSGCKLVALDQFGNLLDQDVIYLVGRAERKQQAKQKVLDLVRRFQLTVAVIGNGTACRESEKFFAELIDNELKDAGVAYVIVNEAGASVYSTSAIGREEFPDYDATLRGAISIGRRLQDPLSELVKIDAASIGVGLYQHDLRAKHLKTSLDEVVESCVNYVAVDVNTASPALLRYVSGLNQLTARRIYEHRTKHGPFRNRRQLSEVAGFGEATFVQAAGFLKIRGGDNPLDSTWIHPESYEAATAVLAKLGHPPEDLADKQSAADLAKDTATVDVEAMAKELGVGTLTLKDILVQLARPGRDPREDLPKPVFKQGVLKLEDLAPGMELTGTVLNVVDFGAFVDIGMHDSGLVHVSQLADKFIRDPHEAVAVGDIVKVWVIAVDKERRRVSLTMIKPGTERPRHARRGGKAGDRKATQPKAAEAKTSEGRTDDRKSRTAGGRSGGQPKGKPRDAQRSKQRGAARSRDSRRRDQDRRPAKARYRPRPQPKPIVPLTKKMKEGKEPMRTFGDLAQFFQAKQEDKPDDQKPPKKKTRKRNQKPPKPTPETANEQPDVTSQPPATLDAVAEPTAPTPGSTHQPAPAGEPPKASADEVLRSQVVTTESGDNSAVENPVQEDPVQEDPQQRAPKSEGEQQD